MKIHIKDRLELSLSEIRKILELLTSIWPPQVGFVDTEKMIQDYSRKNLSSFNKVLLYFKGEELIGHTEIFNREIIVDSERKEILALAGVCVKPEYRGKDIGYSLVENAFRYVDNGQFSCSIFQTNVPVFYERFDCKQIQNKFINGKSTIGININPWRDPYVMVYPETCIVGDNDIDLNGEGY